MLPTAIRRCSAVLLLAIAPAVSALEIVKPVPAPPQLAAKAYVLMEYSSGRVLVEHNADKAFEPASLTKIMTDYIVSDELAKGSLDPEEEVTISEKAWKMGGSKMFIEVGKKVKVMDLIKGMVIQSGNDASVQLAETVAGSEETFVELMNQYAKHLGMRNTQFKNATGMPDPAHLSSAEDMALLARSFIRDFPEDYKIYSIKTFEHNGIKQKNRNGLLWSDDSVDGMKTGHTESAGYGLVASAVRDDMRLIAVVMGTNSANARLSSTAKLLSYGFRFFRDRHRQPASLGWRRQNGSRGLDRSLVGGCATWP
ncbi:MAG: D-alanyl-D-alanine carboxypeptidase family protein [Granulosicoccaceae bacterium]